MKSTPLPKVLFFTAEPMFALEIQALNLTYNSQFTILCKRQFSELKNALENYFYEVLFLDLSHLSDPLGMINIIDKLSPATLIFAIDSNAGVDYSLLRRLVNEAHIYRFVERPFNFAAHVPEVEKAVETARIYHKNVYNTNSAPMLISEELPNVILLHDDFRFGARAQQACAEIAQLSWAANLSDLRLLLKRYEPWAIITGGEIAGCDALRACFTIHHNAPNICFGMVAGEAHKNAIIRGINHFALRHVGTEDELCDNMEGFFTPLLEGYENNLCQSWRKLIAASAPYPDDVAIDVNTQDFLQNYP